MNTASWEQRTPLRFLRDTRELFMRWRMEMYAPAPWRPPPPQLHLWCTRPEADFPGTQIPRRKRAELVLAAALAADALPARDVRPRPPQAPALSVPDGGVEESAEDPSTEPAEEELDFSAEGIRRHIQQRWDHRPNGIRHARWQEMMESFAQRMAARVASEERMASSGSAAGSAEDADPVDPENQNFLPVEHSDQEEPQQSEQEAAGAGEPQNSLSSAVALE